jgi:hypothetical protein
VVEVNHKSKKIKISNKKLTRIFKHTYKYKNFNIRLWVIKNKKFWVWGSITGTRWTLFSINAKIAVYKLNQKKDLHDLKRLIYLINLSCGPNWMRFEPKDWPATPLFFCKSCFHSNIDDVSRVSTLF